MARQSKSPRLKSGIPPAFERKEELSAREAKQRLKELLTGFSSDIAEWQKLRGQRVQSPEGEN